MNILIRRIAHSEEATIGMLYVDGQLECWTLEDQPQAEKVAGETRIPAGTYPLISREYARMYERYRKKYAWHRGMIEVADVPGFTDILFHLGNKDDDTAGCILVGRSAKLAGDYTIPESLLAYEPFYKKVIDAVCRCECTLTIVDDEDLATLARGASSEPSLEERVRRLEMVIRRFGSFFDLDGKLPLSRYIE